MLYYIEKVTYLWSVQWKYNQGNNIYKEVRKTLLCRRNSTTNCSAMFATKASANCTGSRELRCSYIQCPKLKHGAKSLYITPWPISGCRLVSPRDHKGEAVSFIWGQIQKEIALSHHQATLLAVGGMRASPERCTIPLLHLSTGVLEFSTAKRTQTLGLLNWVGNVTLTCAISSQFLTDLIYFMVYKIKFVAYKTTYSKIISTLFLFMSQWKARRGRYFLNSMILTGVFRCIDIPHTKI